MRVICHHVMNESHDPEGLTKAVGRLIDRVENGRPAVRVVAASVQLYSPAGEADPDLDIWLVTLSTTSGPGERGANS